MAQTRIGYREVIDEEGDWRLRCSVCRREVEHHCPDHAPRDVPGLERIDCDKGHLMWIPQTDCYPLPCLLCLVNEYAKRERERNACRHWPWRRWKAFRWLVRQAYVLGVIGGSAMSWGNGCDGCVHDLSWRGSRPYILGWPTWKWWCLRGGHWPGVEVYAGMCGKCAPCQECGSVDESHRPDCPDGES